MDGNSNFYRQDPTGLVLSSQPVPLQFTPDGWEDVSIINERNDDWFGVDRTLTQAFNFVRDGAFILKTIFYTQGTEIPVYLVICQKKLAYSVVGSSLAITTGTNPFTSDTTGTITGIPGQTAYFKFNLTNFINDSYMVVTVGSSGFTITASSNQQVYSAVIPDSGVLNFSVAYNPHDGTASASIAVTNEFGVEGTSYGYWYKQMSSTQIDFSTFVHNDYKVTVSMLEADLPLFLQNNAATTYSYPTDMPDAKYLKADGINLHETLDYGFAAGIPLTTARYQPAIAFEQAEGEHANVFNQTQDYSASSGSDESYFINSTNFLLQNTGKIAISFDIIGQLKLLCTNNNHEPADFTRGWFVVANSVNNTYAQLDDIFRFTPANGSTTTVNVNTSITLQPNDKLFFFQIHVSETGDGSPPTLEMQYVDDSTLSISFTSRKDASYIHGYSSLDLYKKLITSISGGTLEGDSELLAQYDNIIFISGNGVRGIAGSSVQTTLKDFYDFFNSWQDVGLTMKGGKVVLELKKNLIDYTTVISLGEVSNLSSSVKTNVLFNLLNIGPPQHDASQAGVNGLQEFNVPFQFSLGALTVAGTLDKTTKYITGCYASESVRVTYDGTDTTDSTQDTDVYPFYCENTLQPADGNSPNPFYNLDRSLNPFITAGLVEPATVFNLAFTPKRSLVNNAGYIHSCLDLKDSKTLSFVSSPSNSSLVCNGIIEDANVNIGSLIKGYFRPYIFKFDLKQDNDILDQLDNNPLSVFSFTYLGYEYVGIISKVSLQPGTNQMQTYELICGANTDITTLINDNG